MINTHTHTGKILTAALHHSFSLLIQLIIGVFVTPKYEYNTKILASCIL